MISPFFPTYFISAGATRKIASIRAKYGSIEAGVYVESPRSLRQRASVRSGARKQVPELIVVVPPTVCPSGRGIVTLPIVAVRPWFR